METPLAAEREALGEILKRLMEEVSDLETLCKHAPRIVSVAVNAARVQSALTGEAETDDIGRIRKALLEVENDATEEETW